MAVAERSNRAGCWLGQDDYFNPQGDRSNAPFTKQGNTKFVQQFTDHIPELAEAHPAFAELQNLFDWLVVCTLIKTQQLDASIQWQPQVLGDASQLPTRVYPVPTGVNAVSVKRCSVPAVDPTCVPPRKIE